VHPVADRRLQFDLDFAPAPGSGSVFDDVAKKAAAADAPVSKLRDTVGKIGPAAGSASAGVAGFSGPPLQGINRLNEGVSRLTGGLGFLVGQVPALRGLQASLASVSGTATVFGQLAGGAGGAGAGIGAGVFGAVAAAVAAIGAAAVLASPRLQGDFGNALLEVSGKAKQLRDSLRGILELQKDLASQRIFGVQYGDQLQRQREALIAPFEDRQRQSRLEIERREATARSVERFPEQALPFRARALQQAGEGLGIALGNQYAPAGDILAQAYRVGTAAGAGPDPATAQQRTLLQARTEQQAADRELEAARARAANVRRLTANAAELAAAARNRTQARLDVEAAQQEYGEYFSTTSLKQFQSAGPARRNLEIARRRERETQGEFERTQARFGALDTNVQAGEADRAAKAVAQAEERAAAAANARREAEVAANRATVEGLRQVHANLETNLKSVRDFIRAEKERIAGAEERLGLSTPEERLKALEVSRKLKRGEQLTPEELQTAGANRDIFGPQLRELGQKNALNDPVVQEILRNANAQKRLNEAKQAEQALIKVEAKLVEEIKVSVAAGDQLEAALNRAVIPLLKATIEQAATEVARSIARQVAEEFAKKMEEIRAQQNAAG
jgi:hypothetical protein